MENPFACVELMARLIGGAEALAAAAKLGNHRDYRDDGAQAWNLVSIGRTRLRAHPLSPGIFGHDGLVIQQLARLLAGLALTVLPTGIGGALALGTLVLLAVALNYRNSAMCESASDRLRQIVAVALLLRCLAPESQPACVATILFVAFNSVGSYPFSVIPKLSDIEWRSGRKAFHVLNSPFYGGSGSMAKWLFRHPTACRLLTWQVLGFEACFPLSLLLGTPVSVLFVTAGLMFHGVNRGLCKLPGFMMAYGATYPAVLHVGRLCSTAKD